jgi:dethiobiotin synthetase
MPAEKAHRGLFITGTDTGVGKTLVAAALALFLRRRDLNIGVMKPVETGVEQPEGLGPDAELLRWAAECEDDPALLSPFRLRTPLAPALAAEREGVRIDPAQLVAAAGTLMASHEFMLVEGAGGLMVPVSGGFLIADLALQLALPLLIVCRPGLGTINHTLLTVHAARTLDLPVAGFIINGMPEKPDAAEAQAPHALASLASADILGVLPQVTGSDAEKVEKLTTALGRMPTLPWLLHALGV